MTFTDPRWLWALLALPFVALLEWAALRRARTALERLVGSRESHALLSEVRPGARIASAAFRLAALALLVLGAARPEWGHEVVRRGTRGSDLVLVADVSASMDARDVAPTRLDDARRGALAVVDRMAGSRLGVVAFAGDAVRLCPLTLDRAAARLALESLSSVSVSEPGTDLGRALRLAGRMLPPGRRQEQAIVLWTDGEDLERGAEAALDDLAGAGIHVFVVGVGTRAGDVVPVVDDEGRAVDIKRDENGNAVRSRLDEDLLREIARRTRGACFFDSRPGEALPQLLATLGSLSESGRANRLIERPVARFPWCAAAAALLLGWERVHARRRRRENARRTGRVAGAAAAGLAMLVLGSAGRACAQSAWARGDAAFRAEHYAAAESLYTLRLKHGSSGPVEVNRATARALRGDREAALRDLEQLARRADRAGTEAAYNQGTVLGEASQDEAALAALRHVLERSPGDEDARWNYEVIARRIEARKSPNRAPPRPTPPQPSPSQPPPVAPRSGQNPSGPQPPAPQQQGPPPPPQGPAGAMSRAQAEQLLNALEEMQRMDQQHQHRVRVLKERRGRDW